MLTKSVAFLGMLSASSATVGVDLSQATSLSSLQCVHDYGYDFAIARVYCSTGKPDSNGPSNINNAWNAGMSHVDGYIFPCYSCGNPAKQVSLRSIQVTIFLTLIFYVDR